MRFFIFFRSGHNLNIVSNSPKKSENIVRNQKFVNQAHEDEFILLHFNVQCITNKIPMLDAFFEECKPLILCLSETWLTPTNLNVFNLQNYRMISSFCRKTHVHGGTAIFANKIILQVCKPINYLNNLSVELSFECSAVCLDKNSCIIVIYKSPALGVFDIFIEQFTKLLQLVSRKYSDIYICGDFNVDKLKDSTENHILHDLLRSYGLNSLIHEPTRVHCGVSGVSRTAIDYVITNKNNARVSLIDPGISDHSAQILQCPSITSNTNTIQSERSTNTRRILNDNAIRNFKFYFKNVPELLAHSYNVNDIDDYFELFWAEFIHCFELSFPKTCIKATTKPSRTQHKIKFSPELQAESQNVKELNRLKKYIHDENLNKQYKIKKNQYNKNIIKERQLHNKKIIENSHNKTKTMWEIINSNLGRIKAHDNIILNHEDHTITDASKVSSIFAEHYATSIEKKLSEHFNVRSEECTHSDINSPTMFFAPVTPEEISDIIIGLPNKKSTGEDEVPIKLIKECRYEFSICFANIINKSISLGKFPEKLKTALIIPVFKKGDKCDKKNYRPISLLSIFSKIIEKIVALRLTDFLNNNNLLTPSQHGFRNKFSTETAATELIQNIHNEIDAKNYVMGVFFDLSNAFDTLDIAFVSEKLFNLGIRGILNDWIVSYLTNRKLCVKIDKETSEKYDINIGTPQGSILGPLLFLLFVNDLPQHFKSVRVYMYADDTTFIISAKELTELRDKVNGILQLFDNWCYKNRLIINYDKTVCINFKTKQKKIDFNFNLSFNNCPVTLRTETKFLGIFLDENISWSKHIDQLCSKLAQSCFAICNLKNNLDKKSLLSVYYALVYSNLSYNIIVWGQSVDTNRIFILQKRILRIIFDMGYRESCRTMFRKESILTLTSIYLFKLLIYIHTNRNKLPISDHQYSTRKKGDIYINKCNLTLYKKSPLYAGSYLYNKLPPNIKNFHNMNKFKAELKRFLISNCFYSLDEYNSF